jgi:hypothetical protein
MAATIRRGENYKCTWYTRGDVVAVKAKDTGEVRVTLTIANNGLISYVTLDPHFYELMEKDYSKQQTNKG